MTSITDQLSLTTFLDRVGQLDRRLGEGLTKLVPDWWDDSLNQSASISQQVILGLANFANLDLVTVVEPKTELKFNPSVRKFKHAANKSVEDLQAATAVVDGVAKIASSVAKKDYRELPTAREIRELILSSGSKYVDFLSLLDFSWSMGIPVLYMPEIPAEKKMDAVAIRVSERPVIALTKKQKHASSLLFSLAHELGHIASGHLESNSLLIDEKIDENNVDNPQEREANTFAIELLCGKPDTAFHSKGWITGDALAEAAIRVSKERQIDPGHVALNYAKTMVKKHSSDKFYGISGKALNLLYPEIDWETKTSEIFLKHVDEFKVSEDKFEILCRMNNIEV